jgi:hypothetical protein
MAAPAAAPPTAAYSPYRAALRRVRFPMTTPAMPPPSPPIAAPIPAVAEREPLRTPALDSTRVTDERDTGTGTAIPFARTAIVSDVIRVRVPTSGMDRSCAARSQSLTRVPTSAVEACTASGAWAKSVGPVATVAIVSQVHAMERSGPVRRVGPSVRRVRCRPPLGRFREQAKPSSPGHRPASGTSPISTTCR